MASFFLVAGTSGLTLPDFDFVLYTPTGTETLPAGLAVTEVEAGRYRVSGLGSYGASDPRVLTWETPTGNGAKTLPEPEAVPLFAILPLRTASSASGLSAELWRNTVRQTAAEASLVLADTTAGDVRVTGLPGGSGDWSLLVPWLGGTIVQSWVGQAAKLPPPRKITPTGHEVFLMFGNHALASDGATVTATSTATGGELEAENLTSERLSAAWRSGSIAGVLALQSPGSAYYGTIRLIFALGGPRTVNAVSLHRHNNRIPWRVFLYKGDPAKRAPAVADTDWLDPIVRASLRDFGWKDLHWGLGPRRADLDRWQSLFRLDSLATFSTTYYGIRYVEIRFDISSGSNYGVDYVQASLPIICRSFQPRINMPTGWSIPMIDRSLVRRTQGGAVRGRRRPIHRGFAFSLAHVDRDEAFERILTEWTETSGLLGLTFAWPEPEQRRYFYQTRLLGTLTQLPRVEMDKLEWPAATGFVIEETE